jgi:hypothetical protein
MQVKCEPPKERMNRVDGWRKEGGFVRRRGSRVAVADTDADADADAATPTPSSAKAEGSCSTATTHFAYYS